MRTQLECVFACCASADSTECLPTGTGGGLLLSFPTDEQSAGNAGCSLDDPSYYQYSASTIVTLSSVTIQNNSAVCNSCSGGGLSLGVGGMTSISDSVFVNNSAGQLGGGLLFGNLQTSTTCGFLLSNCTIAGNIAVHGGSQLYSTCAANASFFNTTLSLRADDSQV